MHGVRFAAATRKARNGGDPPRRGTPQLLADSVLGSLVTPFSRPQRPPLLDNKVYEYYITLDVDEIGVELLSIPLKADCQVRA